MTWYEKQGIDLVAGGHTGYPLLIACPSMAEGAGEDRQENAGPSL